MKGDKYVRFDLPTGKPEGFLCLSFENLIITLLGTSGMMPLPNRHLTSLIIKYNGYGILIDCGEGTQLTSTHD